MSAALSPGAAIPASSLAVCIGAAGFALLAAARVAARRGPA
jgi:NADPH-dependent 2,4-dienoyl-CoA reductase/sulfur reductase-like enzyme